ncbi:hypothetical protein SUGI_0679040 [Cryptomeria japonica]|nr:hypothetical protein SUGI_0679040 [Cryptomeria japonica]
MAEKEIVSCAACRHQRRKCSEECILAPHFPSHDPEKFAIVESVYEIDYIIKLLQGLATNERDGAVNSLVNEASARLKDPIQGSASAIQELKDQIVVLESKLLATKEELTNTHAQYDKLSENKSARSGEARVSGKVAEESENGDDDGEEAPLFCLPPFGLTLGLQLACNACLMTCVGGSFLVDFSVAARGGSGSFVALLPLGLSFRGVTWFERILHCSCGISAVLWHAVRLSLARRSGAASGSPICRCPYSRLCSV